MIIIPREFVVHPHADEKTACQADDETDEIDGGEDRELVELPDGDFEVVLKHGPAIPIINP
jgi:hypothetical protein